MFILGDCTVLGIKGVFWEVEGGSHGIFFYSELIILYWWYEIQDFLDLFPIAKFQIVLFYLILENLVCNVQLG